LSSGLIINKTCHQSRPKSHLATMSLLKVVSQEWNTIEEKQKKTF
jgi:hypothetical protein